VFTFDNYNEETKVLWSMELLVGQQFIYDFSENTILVLANHRNSVIVDKLVYLDLRNSAESLK
jgi:hypothetical protein